MLIQGIAESVDGLERTRGDTLPRQTGRSLFMGISAGRCEQCEDKMIHDQVQKWL